MKVFDFDNSLLLSVSSDGDLKDGSHKKVGSVTPYRPKFFKVVAAYFLFVDPAIGLPGFYSLVSGTKGKGKFL
jgi:hypothetical protein